MTYSIERLPDNKWGIYSQVRLVATIRCYYTGLKILEILRREARALALQNLP